MSQPNELNTPQKSQSERLSAAADEMAAAVAAFLPPGDDLQKLVAFRAALGTLLAETLGGATVMAAGAVVALDTKIERLASARGQRLREIQADVDRISVRVHALEDQFLDDGAVGRIEVAAHQLAVEVEQLKERVAGDEQPS